MVVGRLFVQERLNPKHKEAAIQMFTNIKSALNNKINTSDWMAKEDVVQTMEKVKNVNASIGSPPDMWNITKENETFIYIRELNEKKYFENNLICAESAVLNNLRRLFDNDPHK
ncbi:hypothetical protein D915_009748 [Fasciola hepatica]|uniref:Peptidase M13 N-terminal domain-containing protein n=1 Tax=Fasciola hepatica TaxID=6192 RepID=A0A4E0RRE6_FASHE|nr:hypothetical protein D915_009748 [Fasciola hepatica]